MSKKNKQPSCLYSDAPIPNIPTLQRKSKRIAFGWYGGKFSHLSWLLPLLLQTKRYCEPFAGSAAVLINRPPSEVETYNDMDGEVVHFFRTLRDHGEELAIRCSLTPFSREEYALAMEPSDDPIERARRFFILARQTRTGLAQTASLGRWANCRDTSRAGMSGVVSRWIGGCTGLQSVAERLIRVQIENRPALDIVKIYDGDETLFYCDPPYVHSTRTDRNAYGYEMTDEAHIELAKALLAAKGKVAISGYRSDLYSSLFGGWNRYDSPESSLYSANGAAHRTESLWANYDLESLATAAKLPGRVFIEESAACI